MFSVATSGGTLGWFSRTGGDHAKADALVNELLAAPPPKDANDFIYQWASSADYDPSSALERIRPRSPGVESPEA